MFEIHSLLARLASRREIFHSEADFRHAFAWLIHEAMPDSQIRLEAPLEAAGERLYLDIWLPTEGVAIELKYPTKKLELVRNGEYFALRDQRAQDTRRYDFLKDVQRLEQVTAKGGHGKVGFAVLLTNDPLSWAQPRREATVDSAFRIHEGRIVNGELMWAPQASPGTTQHRDFPIHLEGGYVLSWQSYSRIDSANFGAF
jgi:hypothetical protein